MYPCLCVVPIDNSMYPCYNTITIKQTKSSEGRWEYRKGKQEDNARVRQDKRD